MNKNQIEEIDFNTLSSTQERYIDIEPYIEKGLNKFDEGIEEKMRKRLQEKNPITKMSVRNNQEGQNIYIASSENGFSTALEISDEIPEEKAIQNFVDRGLQNVAGKIRHRSGYRAGDITGDFGEKSKDPKDITAEKYMGIIPSGMSEEAYEMRKQHQNIHYQMEMTDENESYFYQVKGGVNENGTYEHKSDSFTIESSFMDRIKNKINEFKTGGNEETRSIHKANNPFKNRPN